MLFLVSSLSPSQFCKLKTTAALVIGPSAHCYLDRRWMVARGALRGEDACGICSTVERGRLKTRDWCWLSVDRARAYHPMYLLRIKTAAMGMVEERVDWNSGASPPFGAGS